MTAVVHDFKASLKWGEWAQQHFLDVWHGRRPALIPALKSERRWDFGTSDGRTLELKSERRAWTETEFMFLEQGVMGKAGGPWRAAEDAVDIYAWWFPEPSPVILWWDDVPGLVKWCDNWLAQKKRFCYIIKNKGFSGRGYKVPRKSLEQSGCKVFRL